MFSFGFSWIGALFLVLLFIPKLIWAKHQPEGYDPGGEGRFMQGLERVGQILVTAMSLCFGSLTLRPWTVWSWFLVAASFCMALYEGFWLRYFLRGHSLGDFYGSFCGIPVAGATLPVLAAICLGLYGQSLWFVLAALILGIGHIGIHLQHKKELFLQRSRKNNA